MFHEAVVQNTETRRAVQIQLPDGSSALKQQYSGTSKGVGVTLGLIGLGLGVYSFWEYTQDSIYPFGLGLSAIAFLVAAVIQLFLSVGGHYIESARIIELKKFGPPKRILISELQSARAQNVTDGSSLTLRSIHGDKLVIDTYEFDTPVAAHAAALVMATSTPTQQFERRIAHLMDVTHVNFQREFLDYLYATNSSAHNSGSDKK
ncbi:MAG: hypothetical protein WAO49_08285 [Arcanobacterium sp.]